MKSSLYALVALAISGLTSVFAAEDTTLIAREARTVLKQHCFACHHGASSSDRKFDATQQDTMLKGDDEGDAVVVSKKPEDSLLYSLMKEGRMPPKRTKVILNPDEIAKVEKWISIGAPSFPVDKRPEISIEATLTAIRDDLRNANPSTRPYLRYFTLTHLHNNPRFLEDDLISERAALSFAINSLSWRPGLVLPKPIDKSETIFVVNIRDLDWDKQGIWKRILSEYPYGLDFADNKDENIRQINSDIKSISSGLVYIRADWFSATATRPPLYHDILGIPKTQMELERRLGVNINERISRGEALRAGFPVSGVSGQNRLLERHDSPVSNYLWISYDFEARTPKSNLNRFPLGPLFPGHSYPQQAFIHAGGELIWGLPNGLQAYMLIDGKGNRIDKGPTEVVSDSLKTSGTPAIVNGLSCMHCHKAGMIYFDDTIREGHALQGKSREVVRNLFPIKKDMDVKVKEDEERFVVAALRTLKPYSKLEARLAEFQKNPKNKNMTLSDVLRAVENPVAESARRYLLTDLDLSMAAAELGMLNPGDLAVLIKGSDTLQALGLLPLAKQQLIKRSDWETREGTSLFQEIANELNIASPVNTARQFNDKN